jgi:hypothetical protein
MKRLIFSFALLLAGLSAISQDNDSLIIRRIADDILNNGKAYEDLRYLCKKIGARLSGSANAAKSVEATAKMLREAGADTVYLQPCMVPHWVRGAKEQGVIQWGTNKKSLNVCALGMSVGTPAAGLKPEVIEVANFDELKSSRR